MYLQILLYLSGQRRVGLGVRAQQSNQAQYDYMLQDHFELPEFIWLNY